IQSRLQPQIEVGFPSADEEIEILKSNLPEAPEDVIKLVSAFLQRSHEEKKAYTTRDGVNISRYAIKLLHLNQSNAQNAVEQALKQVLDPAAHHFFIEHCIGLSEDILQPLEVLLLGSSDIEFVADQILMDEDDNEFEIEFELDFDADDDLDDSRDTPPDTSTPPDRRNDS
ncbi:MAG: hypothetical protein GW833_07150, partial [Desulfuromonadales bacterium]|nr:hypothetical protein [Desulfuromonadales bacterium]